MNVSVVFKSSALLSVCFAMIASPTFASSQVAPTRGFSSVQIHKGDKENRGAEQKTLHDQAIHEILTAITQEYDGEISGEKAAQIVTKVDALVGKKFTKFQEKREAKKQVFAALHGLIDEKYTALGGEWHSTYDQIEEMNKEIKKPENADKKAELFAKRNELRLKLNEIKKNRGVTFEGLNVIEEAHNRL